MAGDYAFAQFDEVGEHPDRGQEVLLELLVGHLQLAGERFYLLFEAGIESFQCLVLGECELFQADLLALQGLALEGLTHGQQHVLVIPRLGDVAGDLPGVDGRNGRFHIGIAGEQQAHGVRVALAGFGQEGGAVHARHAHVRDNQIHVLPVEDLKALCAPSCHQHGVAVGAEEAPQGRQDVGFVVNAQEGEAAVFGGCAHAWAPADASWWTGRVMRKVVPVPGALLTLMLPR